jgi:hypothetical protein
MIDKERLKEIKKELELDWSDISYVVNQDDVKWLINRVEELEQIIGDLDENVVAFETLWLEEKRKNKRYKQALEEIRSLYPLRNIRYQVSEIRKIVIKALEGDND